ncbi:MAG: hypothetical protein GX868_13405 [Actinobacteria bacterium]|nr:hypothetical protein [Actinomycetota bacterium]
MAENDVNDVNDVNERTLAGTLAAAASVGAGAIHLVAAGVHGSQPEVARAFLALGLLQMAWGLFASERRRRWVFGVGVLLGVGAVAGWVAAITSGVPFVDGLDEPTAVRAADLLAAFLAGVTAGGAIIAMLLGGEDASSDAKPTDSSPGPRSTQHPGVVSSSVVALITVFAAFNAIDHDHGTGHGNTGHDDDHWETHETASADALRTEIGEPAIDLPLAPPLPTNPYLATLPVDLSGMPGVSAEQQQRAEDLVERTIERLPQFADVSTLNAKGYFSIEDAFTGHEHFVNWDFINDGRELDPDFPESLVFEMVDGKKTLVSAMYMAEGGVGLDGVPDIGGPMTQWHIHDNLCYSLSDPPRVAGLTMSDGTCGPGTRSMGTPVPMIHVWIRPHKCGPFAALDGIGAGQVNAGETTLCDAVHGHGH